jgi:exodeoxyribonuclease VII large subunit
MSLKKQIELMRLRYEKCMKSRVFTDPMRRIRDMDVVLDSYVQRLENKVRNIQKDNQTKYIELVSKLDALSPLKTLTRGYTLTEKDNQIVKSVKELKQGDEIKIRFYDGEKIASVN